MKTFPVALLACLAAFSASAQDIVKVGKGSYTTRLPAGAKAPQKEIYRTERVKGPMPTNDWWSSLAWKPFGDALFPHPLAVKAEPGGLRVAYPGANITANKSGIFGGMPAKPDDFTIGHSAVAAFPDARVDGYSDWFVDLLFAAPSSSSSSSSSSSPDAAKTLRTSFGHGSPFVYVTIEGGDVTLDFGKAAPKVLSPAPSMTADIVFQVGNRFYAALAPVGSKWSDLQQPKWNCTLSAGGRLVVAVLRQGTVEAANELAFTLDRKPLGETRVEWQYSRTVSVVSTMGMGGPLSALYPHQKRHKGTLSGLGVYNSVRGEMMMWPDLFWSCEFGGMLPALPLPPPAEKTKLATLLAADLADKPQLLGDTYWLGKQLGKWATLLPIAEQLVDRAAAAELTRRIKAALENFFTATDATGAPKAAKDGVFYYDANWGTLIGYPASFGSDVELNDHHFHYGYFIRAAAEIARRDPAWAQDWGGMVSLLIRDIASADRDDKMFPFLRNFDPYAGHSWASGHAKFADGNNNESSSEAVNAWYGLILWAEATGDTALRDLGVWLYSTEIAAIEDYWFNVHGDLWPKEYTPSVVTMVWGGKGANATWFSANPEAVHGINWLPFTPASLYLGRYPDYCAKNYAALVDENRIADTKKIPPNAGRPEKLPTGLEWDQWADLVWMYRALSDPADALKQFEARSANFKPEAGNSMAFTYLWLTTLAEYGHVDRTVTADTPFYAVFNKAGKKTRIAWNGGKTPRKVTFSDGTAVDVAPGAFAVK